ncbi:MAG: AEC family transporter [Lachnospiraceae bacterium]|nr:AEC family transporter [Lachnospiraceae bacterium]
MLERYIKVIIMLLILALGYVLREVRLFSRDDAKTISKIMMNLTLPATIITNLNGTRLTKDILGAILLGFAVNAFFFLFYLVFSDKKDRDDRYVKLFCMCSFNIGSLTYPLMTNFASPLAQSAVLTFNYPGTAVFTYGIPNAVGERIRSGEKGFSLKQTLRSMSHSVTTIACFGTLILCLFSISLPAFVIRFTGTVAMANTALAMLLTGIMLNLKISRRELAENIKVVLMRLAASVISALVIYFLLPFSEEVRCALTVTVFSPIATAMPAQALHSGYEGERVAIVNSIYMVISIVIMTALIAWFY